MDDLYVDDEALVAAWAETFDWSPLASDAAFVRRVMWAIGLEQVGTTECVALRHVSPKNVSVEASTDVSSLRVEQPVRQCLVLLVCAGANEEPWGARSPLLFYDWGRWTPSANAGGGVDALIEVAAAHLVVHVVSMVVGAYLPAAVRWPSFVVCCSHSLADEGGGFAYDALYQASPQLPDSAGRFRRWLNRLRSRPELPLPPEAFHRHWSDLRVVPRRSGCGPIFVGDAAPLTSSRERADARRDAVARRVARRGRARR